MSQQRKAGGRAGATGLLVALSLATAGCGGGGTAGGDDPAARFRERLDAGAECPELFRLRNELDPSDERIPGMNAQLRSIGCHDSSSRRSD